MKKIVLLSMFVAFVSTFLSAQILTPALSPAAKVEQRIGLTDVQIEYSRPSKKGRVIFGDLVPFDQPWRTGANASTKITFSDDVNFGGTDVKKGTYALLSKPGQKTWSFMLYPYTITNFSSYLESDVQPTTITTDAITLPSNVQMESMMFGFDNLTTTSGDLFLMWDNLIVPVTIKTNTEKVVEESISRVMAGPSAGDYYSAASYYLTSKRDLNKALEWVNKSLTMDTEKFWVLRTKALIQAELGDRKGAIMTANRSLELAREAKNNDYIKMNTDSIAEWQKAK